MDCSIKCIQIKYMLDLVFVIFFLILKKKTTSLCVFLAIPLINVLDHIFIQIFFPLGIL